MKKAISVFLHLFIYTCVIVFIFLMNRASAVMCTVRQGPAVDGQ